MAKIRALTDEELAKRSGRAGWVLTGVAVLLTVLAVWAVVVAIQAELNAKPDSTVSGVTLPWVCSWAQPLFLCLMAVALWPLAIAALIDTITFGSAASTSSSRNTPPFS